MWKRIKKFLRHHFHICELNREYLHRHCGYRSTEFYKRCTICGSEDVYSCFH